MKTLFDIILSVIGLFLLMPVMLVSGILIKLCSAGPLLFIQNRVGKNGKLFEVYKFRTMEKNADRIGGSVTAEGDFRITPIGKILRKTKLDELPQLFNVLRGDMSFVGPRPDVPEIVNSYTDEMKCVLSIRPGITSVATLHFIDEEKILAAVTNPDTFYKEILVPLKVRMNMEHVERSSLLFDIKILFQTIWMITPFGKMMPIKKHPEVIKFEREYIKNGTT